MYLANFVFKHSSNIVNDTLFFNKPVILLMIMLVFLQNNHISQKVINIESVWYEIRTTFFPPTPPVNGVLSDFIFLVLEPMSDWNHHTSVTTDYSQVWKLLGICCKSHTRLDLNNFKFLRNSKKIAWKWSQWFLYFLALKGLFFVVLVINTVFHVRI